MDKKIQNRFMNDLKKVFERYLSKHKKEVSLQELLLSADLFVDTLKKEMQEWKKEKKSSKKH